MPLFAANSLQNITTDYRIGLGSFVDKKLSPYVSINPTKYDKDVYK